MRKEGVCFVVYKGSDSDRELEFRVWFMDCIFGISDQGFC